MNFSQYQKTIFDSVLRDGSIAVQALAGSGKSTTAVELPKYCLGEKFLFSAFGKSNAEDLKKKLNGSAEAVTFNALGNKIVKNMKGFVKINAYKTSNKMQDVFSKEHWKFKNNMSRMLSLAKNMIVLPEGLEAFYTQYSADYDFCVKEEEITVFLELAKKVLGASIADCREIDFDDQLYLPVINGWQPQKYDVVVIDEAQDLSPVQVELMLRAGKRFVIIGDPNQAIFGFRGADSRAFENIVQRTNSETFSLPVCYRCSKAVIREAQIYVPEIQWSETAKEGSVSEIKKDKFKPVIGDVVVSRLVAPIVTECLKLIKDNKPATIFGRDTLDSLFRLIDTVTSGKCLSIEEFEEKLLEHVRTKIEVYERRHQDMAISILSDQENALLEICESTKNTDELKSKLKSLFSAVEDSNNFHSLRSNCIVFMTIHKSKGLEAPRIYWWDRPGCPHKNAKVDWQKQQERNLMYVATTRAQEELVYIM